jgi:hypothetical protein
VKEKDEAESSKARENRKLRTLIAEFVDVAAGSPEISQNLSRLSAAREDWGRRWERARRPPRVEMDAERFFLHFFPHSDTEELRRDGAWVHPIAEDADEVAPWVDTWRRAPLPERRRGIEAVSRFLERVAAQPETLAAASDELCRSLPSASPPLAAITPLLSALAPDRFVPLHRKTIPVACLWAGREIPPELAHYSDANTAALTLVRDSSEVTRGSLLESRPEADRFASFARWLTTERKAALRSLTFPVSRDRYAEWPPMW